MKLITRLSILFTSVGLVSILIISIFINFFMEKLFREYSIQKQNKKNLEVVSLLKNQYINNEWNIDVIQNIGVSFLEEGLIIKLIGQKQNILWDAREYNNGICQDMIKKINLNMSKNYPTLKGGLTQKQFSIIINNFPVGYLEISYYGPFYYTETEFFFINTLNRLLLLIAITTIIIALLMAFIISRRLSLPITKVILSSRKIAKGKYSTRINIKSSIIEMNQLFETINYMAEKLEAHNKLRDQLTTDVAHELRTPITILQGQIEAIMDGIWKPSPEKIKSIHEEILRLSHLIDDLTILTNYDSRKINLSLTKFNLSKLIEKTIKLYFEEFKTAGILLKYECEDLIITADKNKMNQVLINLFSNSLKHTVKGDIVFLNLIKHKNRYTLKFSDTGKGIPEEDLPFIFERFYRVDKSRSQDTGGFGIGLTIVKEIILAHNGTIKCESKKNNGTTFLITLPLHIDVQ